MNNNTHLAAIELILSAMTKNREDGMMSSFAFRKPGSGIYGGLFTADIYYKPNELIRASLFIRLHGHAYLKYLPMQDISYLLRKFVQENYWCLADDTFSRRFQGTYAEEVSDASKAKLAAALATSELFVPRDELTLFPLVAVQVDADFDGGTFFLIKPLSLASSKLPEGFEQGNIESGSFPPVAEWKGRTEIPTAWLGVRSPMFQASTKLRAAILGALALAPMPHYRYRFSMRPVFGGRCTLSENKCAISFGDSHTPPLMHNIIIRDEDHKWLKTLSSKLLSDRKSARMDIKALEYFYRSWPYSESERYPVLCMTLDAIFGDANHATAAVINGVRSLLGSRINEGRLRKLMDLRASVIHGGAPDVYDSRNYRRYYHDYGADPVYDLELIVSECLRLKVFEGEFVQQSDPNAEIIEMAQAEGRLPRSLERSSILNETAPE